MAEGEQRTHLSPEGGLPGTAPRGADDSDSEKDAGASRSRPPSSPGGRRCPQCGGRMPGDAASSGLHEATYQLRRGLHGAFSVAALSHAASRCCLPLTRASLKVLKKTSSRSELCLQCRAAETQTPPPRRQQRTPSEVPAHSPKAQTSRSRQKTEKTPPSPAKLSTSASPSRAKPTPAKKSSLRYSSTKASLKSARTPKTAKASTEKEAPHPTPQMLTYGEAGFNEPRGQSVPGSEGDPSRGRDPFVVTQEAHRPQEPSLALHPGSSMPEAQDDYDAETEVYELEAGGSSSEGNGIQ